MSDLSRGVAAGAKVGCAGVALLSISYGAVAVAMVAAFGNMGAHNSGLAPVLMCAIYLGPVIAMVVLGLAGWAAGRTGGLPAGVITAALVWLIAGIAELLVAGSLGIDAAGAGSLVAGVTWPAPLSVFIGAVFGDRRRRRGSGESPEAGVVQAPDTSSVEPAHSTDSAQDG